MPLITGLVVFYIAFVKILGSGVPAFPIFLLSGLLVWNLFSTGQAAACGSCRNTCSIGGTALLRGPCATCTKFIRKIDIPIAEITRQYMSYIDVMRGMQLELAGEYLVMAATLAEIKSRMLLPRPASAGEEEADPRAELVRRLQEYERFKRAAMDIEELHRVDRDTFPASAELVERRVVRLQPNVSLQEMLVALKDVMGRAEMFAHHHISRERLSVRQRMSEVLGTMRSQAFVEFVTLFRAEEGRMGVTVTFIAILELLREGLIEIVQSEPYAPIHVRAGTPRTAEQIDDMDDRVQQGPQGTES